MLSMFCLNILTAAGLIENQFNRLQFVIVSNLISPLKY